MSRVKDRLLQYKKDLERQSQYKAGLPGSSLDIVNTLLADLEEDEKENGWIPISERVPENDNFVLISFCNSTRADIGRYEKDEEGGTFYPGDEERSYSSFGLFVNAWRPLPEPCREESNENA